MQIDEKYILTSKCRENLKFYLQNWWKYYARYSKKIINEYFIKTFYGLSGINICFVSCETNDFKSSKI